MKWLVLLLVAACGDNYTVTADANDPFIASIDTFTSYPTWTDFHDDGPPDDGTFPPDVLGPRTQYINQLPPHGATAFPVGTVIVEERQNAEMDIFAGVKRGGGFNAAGAVGWEWFQLAPVDGALTIIWRGIGPPGDTYGGGQSSCNTCHVACGASNDSVCSPELQLANF